MTATPGDVAYQPRTAERLIEILNAQAGYSNPRSWQAEAAAQIAELTAERDDLSADVLRLHNEKVDRLERALAAESALAKAREVVSYYAGPNYDFGQRARDLLTTLEKPDAT